MGRKYSAQFNNVAVSAAQDLFEINAPSTKSVILHSVFVGQASDAGDAQAEMLRILIIAAASTSGSGGSTPTAAPLDSGDAAFGGTVEVNNTTVATGGTPITKHADCFNVQAGWVYRPTPEERIAIPGGGRLVINLPAPADSLTMSGTAIFEEIG